MQINLLTHEQHCIAPALTCICQTISLELYHWKNTLVNVLRRNSAGQLTVGQIIAHLVSKQAGSCVSLPILPKAIPSEITFGSWFWYNCLALLDKLYTEQKKGHEKI